MDVQKLREHTEAGLVRKQSHPSLPLEIYNYADKVQYDRLWDETLLQCRGLVMHGDRIIARPFRKFFNDGEHQPEDIPWHLPCEITEKLDGSLAIAFFFAGDWHLATRGSFTSEQSRVAADLFCQFPSNSFDPCVTYLFEVLFPENRIVVNYGDRRELILLAMIHTNTGIELGMEDAPPKVPVVRRLPPVASTAELRAMIADDQEGYVVRFSNGFRMKVKGQRYMELHRLLSGISSRYIWECLSACKPFNEVLDVIPDEFAAWAKQERAAQLAAFGELNLRVESAYREVKSMPTRKDQAIHLTTHHSDVAPAVFQALNGKPTWDTLWKMLYPEMRRPEISLSL